MSRWREIKSLNHINIEIEKYYYACTHIIPFDEVAYDIYPYTAYLENE